MLNAEELQRLREARRLLETPSLAVRLTDLLGKPLEKGLAMLPDRAARTISAIVRSALERALRVAVATMGESETTASSDGFHRLAGATAGALGGAFGLAGLAVSLFFSSVILIPLIGIRESGWKSAFKDRRRGAVPSGRPHDRRWRVWCAPGKLSRALRSQGLGDGQPE